MGSATLFEETRSSIDTKRFKFEAWCYLEELTHQEDSCAEIRVTEVGALKTAPYWALSVGLDEFSEKWIKRWAEAFCSQPAYRTQFETTIGGDGGVALPRERTNPKTGEIRSQSTLPLIPNPPLEVAAKNISHAVARLLKLGAMAKFQDFVALRSGRDAFSSVKLPALVEMLGEKAVTLDSMGLDDEVKSKVARWALRGLPLDVALHKVKVDLELSENARGKPRR